MSIVTLAAIQVGSPLFDTPAALARGDRLIREAAAGGARLVVLPEAFLGGYPKGLDFGISIGSRSTEGRDLFRRYYQSAVDVPGPETAHLAKLSVDVGAHFVVGAIERHGSTLYCTALFFSPAAGLVAKHRKLMPTAAERYLWGQGDGSTLPAVPTDVGVLGSAICWENYMPLLRQAMYAKGVEIWCAPTVDDREQWQSTIRHIGLEGRCFVVSAAPYLTRADLPADVHPVQGDEPHTVLIDGGSVIASPLGELLAGPLRGQEGVLLAEVDTDDLVRARFDFDSVGHYSRPDVFSLVVDERPRSPDLQLSGRQRRAHQTTPMTFPTGGT